MQANVLRIIDANANRAREALRVMEEAARFLLDDAQLTGGLKSLRHDLARALAAWPGMEDHRDTPADVGTTVTTPTEQRRDSSADVALAAGKRLTEALRAIEEYAKTLPAPSDAAPAAPVEQLRYRAYDLEQRLNRAMGAGRARQWRLCLVLTQGLCRLDWREVLQRSLDAGTDCVQLREKDLDDAELLDRAAFVVERCRGRAAAIINDRVDVARLAGADGVHVGQHDLSPARIRGIAGPDLLIGVSTADLDQARRAARDGADYCGIGPMFPTTTKRKDVIAGPEYARRYVEWGRLPHLAIGGVGPDNVGELVPAAVKGVAVSSAICASEDPGATTAAVLAALANAHHPTGSAGA